MTNKGELKTKYFIISTKQRHKPNVDLRYVRFESRIRELEGVYVGCINSKTEAKKLIALLKKAKF